MVCLNVFLCILTVDTEDDTGYLDVMVSEAKHPPAQLGPMPDGLSSLQVRVYVFIDVLN